MGSPHFKGQMYSVVQTVHLFGDSTSVLFIKVSLFRGVPLEGVSLYMEVQDLA